MKKIVVACALALGLVAAQPEGQSASMADIKEALAAIIQGINDDRITTKGVVTQNISLKGEISDLALRLTALENANKGSAALFAVCSTKIDIGSADQVIAAFIRE
jgi:hypothetical protein